MDPSWSDSSTGGVALQNLFARRARRQRPNQERCTGKHDVARHEPEGTSDFACHFSARHGDNNEDSFHTRIHQRTRINGQRLAKRSAAHTATRHDGLTHRAAITVRLVHVHRWHRPF